MINTGRGSMRRSLIADQSDSSEDEEVRSSKEMGEWLTSLPVTVPYHRGNVLVVPESPYRQKKNGRSLSARTPRSPMKHYTEMYRDPEPSPRQLGDAARNTKKYTYTSPSEHKAAQLRSDLHDELQHQQAALVKEKTALHHAMHGNQPTPQVPSCLVAVPPPTPLIGACAGHVDGDYVDEEEAGSRQAAQVVPCDQGERQHARTREEEVRHQGKGGLSAPLHAHTGRLSWGGNSDEISGQK